MSSGSVRTLGFNVYGLSGTSRELDLANRSQFGDITTEHPIQGTELLTEFGNHTGTLEQAIVRCVCKIVQW